MRDDELSSLLRSPVLSLDPPADLAQSAQAGARRVHRRRQSAAAALAVVLLGAAGLAGSGLLGGSSDRPPDVASPDLRALFPESTTEVVPLARINGGTVYTYFRGSQWCTVSKRTGPPNSTCAGSLPATGVAPFGFLRGPGTESLTVDRDFLVAGVLGDEIASVDVELVGGQVLAAEVARGEGFPRPVWWRQLAPGDQVAGYTARDEDGAAVQTSFSSEETFVIEATRAPG